MKKLDNVKLYEDFANNSQDKGHPGFLKTHAETMEWLIANIDDGYVDHLEINPDTLEVKPSGSINFSDCDFEYILVKFGDTGSGFTLSNCPNLKSLKGMPNEVLGLLEIDGCASLVTLEYFPKTIGHTTIVNECRSLISHGADVKEWWDEDEDTFYIETDDILGTAEEKAQRYMDYLDTLSMVDKDTSLEWLQNVDMDTYIEISPYLK